MGTMLIILTTSFLTIADLKSVLSFASVGFLKLLKPMMTLIRKLRLVGVPGVHHSLT